MGSSLITLPVRVGLRGAGIAVSASAGVAGRALGVAGSLVDALRSPEASETVDLDGQPHVREPAPEPQPAPEPPHAAREPEPPPEPPPPVHISAEPELVEEVAEPGAEEGAGAEVHVAEPWEGYRAMRANDVIDRIIGASMAELAAVELFELSNRRRQSVITAARRERKRAG